jgi:uncharacterized protein (DUF736 family)
MIKNFSLFKAKEKKTPNSPDYLISIKVNDVFATVGAGWIKKAKDNTSYLSCKLSDGYEKSKGFHIEVDTQVVENSTSKEDINANDIPFM